MVIKGAQQFIPVGLAWLCVLVKSPGSSHIVTPLALRRLSFTDLLLISLFQLDGKRREKFREGKFSPHRIMCEIIFSCALLARI